MPALLKSFYGPLLTDEQYTSYFNEFIERLQHAEPAMALSTPSVLCTLFDTPFQHLQCVQNGHPSNEGWVVFKQGGFTIRPYFICTLEEIESLIDNHPRVTRGDFSTLGWRLLRDEKGVVSLFKYADDVYVFITPYRHLHDVVSHDTDDTIPHKAAVGFQDDDDQPPSSPVPSFFMYASEYFKITMV